MKTVSKPAMLIAVALSVLVNLTGVAVAQTVVDTRVVALDTASTDSNLAAVPDGLSFVDSGSTFYVEIWIKNVGLQEVGFFVAIVDVVYTTSLLDVQQVQVDDVFDFAGFSTGTIDQAAGRIDELGGAVGFSDLGSGRDSWAKLAVLEIEAVGAGIATIGLESSSQGFSLFPVPTTRVAWSEVNLASVPLCVGQDADGDGVSSCQD